MEAYPSQTLLTADFPAPFRDGHDENIHRTLYQTLNSGALSGMLVPPEKCLDQLYTSIEVPLSCRYRFWIKPWLIDFEVGPNQLFICINSSLECC